MPSIDTPILRTSKSKLPLHVHLDCSKGVTIPSLWEACLDASSQLEVTSHAEGEEEMVTIEDEIQSRLAQIFPLSSFTSEEEDEQKINLAMIEQMLMEASLLSSSSSSSSSHDTIMPLFIKNSILNVFKVWSMAHDTTTSTTRKIRSHPNDTNNATNTSTIHTHQAVLDKTRMIFSTKDVRGITAILLILQEFIGVSSFSCSILPLELPTMGNNSRTSSSSWSDEKDASTMAITNLLLNMTTYVVNHNQPYSDEREARPSSVTPAAAALLRVLTNTNKVTNIMTSSITPPTARHDNIYQQQMPPSSFVPLAIGLGNSDTSAFKEAKNVAVCQQPLLHLIIGQDSSSTSTSKPTSSITVDSVQANKSTNNTSKIRSRNISDNNNPQNKHWKVNTLTQLEANLDDTTPEVLAYVIETLLKKGGAVDAWVTPIVMKKGRAAHTLHCLVREDENNEKDTATNKVLEIMFRETTTLGIRIQRGIERAALRREFVSIQTPYVKNNHLHGKVDVKVGYFGDDIVSVKAEFDHCREIAQAQENEQITLTQIRQYAERQVWDKLSPSPSVSQLGNTQNISQEDFITSSLNELKVLDEDEQINTTTTGKPKLSTSSNERGGTPLKDFDLYGWRPNPSFSDDENYMDIILLITRSSKCRQGSMACLLVRPSTNRGAQEETEEELEIRLSSHILSAATNQPLFSEKDSDVHAEIAALGCTTQSGLATLGCTAYITMPPCKRCFGALYAAGIVRIVTRSQTNEPVLEKAAQLNGIQMVTCSTNKEQMGRINALVRNEISADARNDIAKERLQRKEERKVHKAKRK